MEIIGLHPFAFAGAFRMRRLLLCISYRHAVVSCPSPALAEGENLLVNGDSVSDVSAAADSRTGWTTGACGSPTRASPCSRCGGRRRARDAASARREPQRSTTRAGRRWSTVEPNTLYRISAAMVPRRGHRPRAEYGATLSIGGHQRPIRKCLYDTDGEWVELTA